MADIDQIIAGGAGASSRADFSSLGTLLDSYWGGKDQKAKNDLRDAFKPTADNPNGIPMLPDGKTPDVPAMAKTFFQKGDFASGTALLGQAQNAAERNLYAGGQPPPSQPIAGNPPSGSAPRLKEVAAPLNKGGVQGPGQSPQGQVTPADYLQSQGIQPGYNMEVGLSYFKRNGIDPDQPFNPNDPKISAQIGPMVQRIKGVGQVQPQQPGDQGAPPPQVGQQQPMPQQQPQQAPQPLQMAPQQAPNFDQRFNAARPGNDPELNRARFFGASPDKATAEAARLEEKAILEGRQPTGPMKEAASQGLTLQQAQERQGEQAAQQAGATERAKNDVAEQQTYIDQGRQAATRLGTLNLMNNIVQSDKKLDLGFGSTTSLKIKMALERVGIDTGDLSGAQLLGKYNSILAAESTKGVASRGTNFEMKTFIANNPGLSMDEKGNIRMLGILSQNAKREYDLGKLARQNQDNWSNWDNVVEKYDQTHQIKDPTTGKVLSTNSIIAPAPKQDAAQGQKSAQPAGIKQFSSIGDVHAAIAAGILQKGDSFVGGDGKTRMVP